MLGLWLALGLGLGLGLGHSRVLARCVSGLDPAGGTHPNSNAKPDPNPKLATGLAGGFYIRQNKKYKRTMKPIGGGSIWKVGGLNSLSLPPFLRS